MTNVYFVRHAQPDTSDHRDRQRGLTQKGLRDRELVTRYLWDKEITAVFSSPYRRAVDTVEPFARQRGLEIRLEEDFRERTVGDGWIEDFDAFTRRQWADFSYKLAQGESLGEVQKRNVEALFRAARAHKNENIVIGSHGTALSTVIRHFRPGYGYADFRRVKGVFPYIVRLALDGDALTQLEEIFVLPE
ncbi:MAG: histidine phosphatase family protein [Eubacteriales bacterium]|nr:histidine phosphatase family protein [Eubacteriales bacterium]